MPLYSSKTGKDAVLRFRGITLTVPVGGYLDHPSEELDKLFPGQVQRNEGVVWVDDRPKVSKTNLPEPLPIFIPIIRLAPIPEMRDITIPTIKILNMPESREFIVENKIIEKIEKTINTMGDPDKEEFLKMIEEIISS